MRRAPARVVFRLLFAAGVITAAAAARADGPAGVLRETTPPVAAAAPLQAHFDGGPGASTTGLHLGLVALVRYRPFALGVAVNASALPFGDSRVGAGGLLGASWHGASPFGFDLLAELGMVDHHVSGGGGFLSSDPGTTAEIPYAGARVGFRWFQGDADARTRFTVGFWLYGHGDLAGRDVSYTYASAGGLFNGGGQTSSSLRVGGGSELGARLALGFDLTP